MIQNYEKCFVLLNENDGQGIESQWSPEEKQFFLDFIDAQPGELVLDLGCGNGVFTRWMRQAGAKVIGADFSFKCHPSTQCDAIRLPFASESFDRIVCIEMLEHLMPKHQDAFFQEIHRVLKLGGVAIVHTSPNPVAEYACQLLNIPLFILKALNLTTRPFFKFDHSEFHTNRNTLYTLRESVKKSGFFYHVEAYTSFCTFPRRLTKRFPILEHPVVSRVFGLRLRAALVKTV